MSVPASLFFETLSVAPSFRVRLEQRKTFSLFYYPPFSCRHSSHPILIVYSFVNRPYILDLMDGDSFIQNLLSEGIPLYLLEWKDPDPRAPSPSFRRFVTRDLPQSVQAVRHHSGQSQIHVMGICQGGVLALLYASSSPQMVKSLLLISTPVDFQKPEDSLSFLLQNIDTKRLGEKGPQIPGTLLTQAFLALNPFRSLRQKKTLLHKIHTIPSRRDLFLRVEKWLHDCPDQRGKVISQFINLFYQRNQLVRGRFKINGTSIDLRTFSRPVLNIVGQRDTLIPPASSLALGCFLPKSLHVPLIYDTGHIGFYVTASHRHHLTSQINQWILNL